MLKLYIAINSEELKKDFAHTILSVSHVTLMAHLAFKDLPEYQDWLTNSFRKCLVLVNNKEFSKMKQLPNVVVATESACGNREITLALAPRTEWPNVVKFANFTG